MSCVCALKKPLYIVEKVEKRDKYFFGEKKKVCVGRGKMKREYTF